MRAMNMPRSDVRLDAHHIVSGDHPEAEEARAVIASDDIKMRITAKVFYPYNFISDSTKLIIENAGLAGTVIRYYKNPLFRYAKYD